MQHPNCRSGWRLLAASVLALGLSAIVSHAASSPADEAVGFLYRTNYHGWSNSLWVSNGKVEAIIVPQVGRVMQFRFAGQKEGPFWENPALLGKPADPKAPDWQNFGGDKVWPAPQKDWGEITPTNWPPPVAFDQTPYEATVDGWNVTLKSAVDPDYGVCVTRKVRLEVGRPVMTIETTFEKVKGQTLDASIWAVTQLKEPLFSCARILPDSRYTLGFQVMSDRRPPSAKITKGLLTLERNPKLAHKVGLDSGALIWVGPDYLLRIDSPRHIMDPYPDDGASAAIYTSPDPLKYVEFEMMGPLVQLRPGHKIQRTSTYSLLPRTEIDPMLEMRKQLPE